MILDSNQKDFANEYQLLPFEVNVLNPKRTICEKIMSLVRFSYSENPLNDFKIKIRHTYDLHLMLQQKEFLDFLNSNEFDIMLLKVAISDIISYKNNNYWINNDPIDAMFFKDLEVIWNELKKSYNSEFKNLV